MKGRVKSIPVDSIAPYDWKQLQLSCHRPKQPCKGPRHSNSIPKNQPAAENDVVIMECCLTVVLFDRCDNLDRRNCFVFVTIQNTLLRGLRLVQNTLFLLAKLFVGQ